MNRLSYEHLLEEDLKPIPAPRLMLAGAILMAASVGPPATLSAVHIGLASSATRQEQTVSLGDVHPYESEAQNIIDRITQIIVDNSLLDENEPPPMPETVRSLASLIIAADIDTIYPMPYGSVSTFFGELNITWRVNDAIVRLAGFPNRPTILQRGNLSEPLGSYVSEVNPTSEVLAQYLDSLSSYQNA